MSVICNVIIPQIDPRVQENINNFSAQIKEECNKIKEQIEIATKSIEEEFNKPEYQELIEYARNNADEFNKRVMAILNETAVKVKKSVINIYKKIVSCSRTPRSNNRTSNFSKSTKGDSGDGGESDQPGDPPSHTCTSAHPHLIPPSTPQKNRFIYSRRLASCSCFMAQGVA